MLSKRDPMTQEEMDEKLKQRANRWYCLEIVNTILELLESISEFMSLFTKH